MPANDSGGRNQDPKIDPRSARADGSIGECFRRGDPAAVEVVHERVARIIAFKHYRIPPQIREELCQEALVQIWQGVNQTGFDVSLGFWGFVQSVAARRCIDWIRRQRPIESDYFPEPVESRAGPLQKVLDRERVELLHAAIEDLPAACREIVRLRIERRMSYAEIGSRDGRSEQALRAQMYRCVARLRETLAETRGDRTE